jgi:tetratricopeptide (TPR) repeat protein
MTPRRVLATHAAALVAAALIPVAASADRIITNNGELKGTIVREDAQTITVRLASGMEMTIARGRIQQIIPSGPGEAEMELATDAERRGNLEEALQFLEKARAAGAPVAEVEKRAGEILSKKRELELLRHQEALNRARAARDRGDLASATGEFTRLLESLAPDSEVRPVVIGELIAVHLAAAKKFRDVVDDAAAIRELQEVQKLDPNRSDAYLELAELYEKSSRTREEAVRCYEKGLQLAGGRLEPREEARRRLALGNLHRDARRSREAFEQYLAAFRLDPRADARLEERMRSEALAAANALIDREPEAALDVATRASEASRNADLMDMKARAEVNLGRLQDARKTWTELLALEPRYRRINYNLAQLAMRDGDPAAARELLEREIALFPDNYEALCQLGDLAMLRDDPEEAERYFRKANAEDPDPARAYIGIARALIQKEKLDEARANLQRVLDRWPDNLEATIQMGRILRLESKYAEAEKFFTKVVTIVGDGKLDAETSRIKADALIARGEIRLLTVGPSTANLDFNAALEAVPDYAFAYFNIGSAYREKYSLSKAKPDLLEARKNLERARELEPKNPMYALALGIFFHQSLSVADAANKQAHLRAAVSNYRDYMALGGAKAKEVGQWIEECGG